MLLNDVQKKTIRQLPDGENYTIGGVSIGEEKRYEVHRVSETEWKAAVYALMICLYVDYFSSTDEVINFIESH
ncbi:hypothetical protein ACDZ28_00040 (plasmid) [Paenibacillus sp. RS8]|uniref:hypothetical protein n=1 Tax=Paenibacillus sp. RS8 TaxID=3242681 RepID=UPI0035C24C92